MKRMLLKLTTLSLVLAAGCAYKPWGAHSTVAPKPASPLQAPADRAMLVVLVNDAQKAGNGSYTVFEREGSAITTVAQVDEKLAAWTTLDVKAGPHRFYVRTWSSAFCVRADADFSAGKIYVLGLNNTAANVIGLVGTNGNIVPRVGFVSTDGGPLNFHPFVQMDVAAARADLESHRSQVDECVAKADQVSERAKAAGGISPAPALDRIEFVVSK